MLPDVAASKQYSTRCSRRNYHNSSLRILHIYYCLGFHRLKNLSSSIIEMKDENQDSSASKNWCSRLRKKAWKYFRFISRIMCILKHDQVLCIVYGTNIWLKTRFLCYKPYLQKKKQVTIVENLSNPNNRIILGNSLLMYRL